MSQNYRKGQTTYMPTAGEAPVEGLRALNALQTTDKAAQRQVQQVAVPTNVAFPPHLYIPQGAQSVDFRRVVNLPTGSVDFELMRFVAPPGAVTRFISYGIFNDGDNGINYEFRPLVDGARVFPYHGDPNTPNNKIYLGLGPDLSNTSLIECQLELQPGQLLQWLITNTSGVDTSMGVRMRGYFDTAIRRTTPRFGG